MIANTPKPPYYAVIFSSIRTKADAVSYDEMAERMVELAEKQPGYLGMETAREQIGITVSYWKDLESIKKWREQAEHTVARELGRERWYKAFKTRIVLVQREYGFEKEE